MAPVDPTDLLKAFRPLLTVLGGIKSLSDVPRLSQLMKRYSKKLVSRCVYCNILLATTPDILLCFLERDGWDLINAWLKESIDVDNYRFICELLDLLVKCPMNIDRLKQNDTPKLVKSLSKHSDKEVSNKAKLVVNKWTELIKPNENVNNGNLAKKKRKKEKSQDDDDGDTGKINKVKGTGGDANNSGDVITAKNLTKTAEDVATNESVSNVNRPRTTAKIKYGKSRSVGILEELNASSGKSKGLNKKGDDNPDKSGPGNKSNNLNNNNSTPVSNIGQPVQSKTASKQPSKPTLKEAVGFIEDIVSLSTTGQGRKRRKSDSKSKSSSTPGSNTAKDSGTGDSNQADEPGTGQEPMDLNDDTSNEVEEERITSASGDDSNSNTNFSNTNTNNNIDDDNDKLPIVPELDNLVIPEIEPSKLSGVIKSILSYGRQSGKSKKSVRWRGDDRLREIKFFELDETERTNVSKSNFGDFRANDIRNERQMLQQLRSNRGNPGTPAATMTPSTDKCITYLPWKLILIDLPPGLPLIESGSQSEEKRIQAAMANNVLLNADFFPIKENPNEYYPKEPDAMEPGGERNDGPTVIPLEDENFTITDYSSLPPPQPRTGENYPANRGLPIGSQAGVPGSFPRPGMNTRAPGVPVGGRTPFPSAGFVPPVAGYPPFAGPGGPGPGPYLPPGAGSRMIPPRPMPGGPAGPPMPGFQGGPGGWPPRPRPPPVCRYFLKSGSCRFMARCNYLHQYPNTNNLHGPGSSSSSNQSHME
ncbi:serine/threonine-protein phosphatase 1 regulatory subunit 10-like [Panonychus citri]|uniref:serine/threonine-protein phosphatase 1 regulatory subunit 10-like n=1 Tax=Panonychus citri TaxID=50023 RepID=UPI0023079530|nr:serine/threonine-protein phosphatase 1 regulatory subunit 10-like [Panonychus citri]